MNARQFQVSVEMMAIATTRRVATIACVEAMDLL